MIVISLLLIGTAVVLLVLGLLQPSSVLLSASIGTSLLAAVVLMIGARKTARASAEAAERPRHAEPRARRDAVTALDRYDRVTTDRAGDHLAATGGGESVGAMAADRPRDMPPGPVGDVPGDPVGDPVGDPDGDLVGAALATGGRAEATEAGPAVRTIPTQGPSDPSRAGPDVAAGAPAEVSGLDAADAESELIEDPPDEPAAQQVSPSDAARVGRMGTEVLVVDGRPRYHLAGCVHLLGRENEPLPVSEAVELGFSPCSLCEPDSALLADARRV